LIPEHLQNLWLDPTQHPRGQTHFSAASGLVRVQNRLYVVADDELHLGMLLEPQGGSSASAHSLSLLRLWEGELPQHKGQRKQAKPDLETLVVLPRLPGCPHGALLALGSGSRPNRETAVLVALDALGVPTGRLAHVSLSALYAPLRTQFTDLNIEGAFVVSGELRLLQRGNKGDARNACIAFDWNQVAPWLAGERSVAPVVKTVQTIALGQVDGVPLCFTDGAALPGGAWCFSAVAENTDNSFQDGACAASVLGVVEPDGGVRQMHPLQGAPKVEGIAVQVLGDALVWTMVTDADDPAIASQLLRVQTTLG